MQAHLAANFHRAKSHTYCYADFPAARRYDQFNIQCRRDLAAPGSADGPASIPRQAAHIIGTHGTPVKRRPAGRGQ